MKANLPGILDLKSEFVESLSYSKIKLIHILYLENRKSFVVLSSKKA